jgi:ribosome-binding protein aMBF1 (putative translation factor)
VGHRAEVDLDECPQFAVLLVQEPKRRVGGERPFACPVLESLSRFALPLIPEPLEPSGPRVGDDGDVQFGQRAGVREKDRVWLLALTATRYGLAAHQTVSASCRPVIVRCRALLTVGATATRQAEVVQAARAIAQRPLGDLGEQPPELILAHHAMRAQHVEQPLVDLGQRAGRRGGGETTRALRDRAGMTQEQLAGLLQMDATYISRIERGRRGVQWLTVQRFLRALGADLRQLAEAIDEQDRTPKR